MMRREVMCVAYQISERIELLAHERALLSPTSDLAIHKVEEQTKGHEGQSGPEVAEIIGVAHAVAEGGHD
jgi:hypothetical protein